jgi:serine/threonine protein phosphatase 1
METAVQRFAANPLGRDFVVGDLHGCFGQLEAALARLQFDDLRDRLFSVGDLVDRGERSADALHWLQKSWFHACMGNHEEMVLTAPSQPESLLIWVMINGGAWWLDLDHEERLRFVAAFSRLPLAMEVESALGRVGIVHADVPDDLTWLQFVAALESGEPRAREIALWGRRRSLGGLNAPVRGIDRVVCGHTIQKDSRVHSVQNVWMVDTGAFLGDARSGLTVLPLLELFQA